MSTPNRYSHASPDIIVAPRRYSLGAFSSTLAGYTDNAVFVDGVKGLRQSKIFEKVGIFGSISANKRYKQDTYENYTELIISVFF